MTQLEKLILLLGSPQGKEDLLRLILETTEQRLCYLLGASSVPAELSYIVLEVSAIRYNRIGSEGTTSHGVEGETMAFTDSDFSGYQDDIDVYRVAHPANRPVVRFL